MTKKMLKKSILQKSYFSIANNNLKTIVATFFFPQFYFHLCNVKTQYSCDLSDDFDSNYLYSMIYACKRCDI